jgi:hypothetical protein
VLVAGLALATVVVATTSSVSVRVLDQIHGDSTSLHDVGGVYAAGWTSPNWNPFVDGRFRILTLLAAIVYMTSVTAIGATIVGAIRGVERWPRTVRLLAGFLPGYLIVLGPLQVLFSGVYYVTAAWISLLVLPVIAVVLHRRSLTAGIAGMRSDPEHRRSLATTGAIIGGILLLAGIYRIQAGRYFMVPDSTVAFLTTAGEQLRGVFGSHLAQWDQQSDEWVFNAPLMFTSTAGQDYLFAFYATGFVALASFAALVFGIVHSVALRRPRIAATLTMGAVLASSAAIYPWDHISLIGGQNPAMWLELPGRLAGIVAPWVALLLFSRQRSRTTVALLLATMGLAFTTISGTTYVGVALVCAGAWHLLRGRGPARLSGVALRFAVPALALAGWAAPMFVYWRLHEVSSPSPLAWYLVAGVAAAMSGAVLLALFAGGPPRPLPPVRRTAAWTGAGILTLGAGFVLSNNLTGNVADGRIRSTLAEILPGYGLPLQSRGVAAGASEASFPLFTGQECWISGHCLSFGYFLAGYGFITVLALAAWFALGQRSSGEDTGPLRAAWLVTVAALAASLTLVDFTGASQITAWVLTRFIEIPYYALLGFAALAFAGSRSRVTAWVGGSVIAAWTVIPLATGHVVPQIAHNADWLMEVIN